GFGDVFGDREQLRYWLERPAEVVLIEPGDDDALAAVRERVARRRQVQIEELPFVDADDFRVLVHARDELLGAPDVLRRDPHVAVRHDLILAVSVVDDRLEDLHLLPRDLRAAQSPNELLALPAEHAAG